MSGSIAPPFALEGIDHVLLLVNGMREALHFYCDVQPFDLFQGSLGKHHRAEGAAGLVLAR